MRLIWASALLYALLHLAGLFYPEHLWGINLLHYYSWPVLSLSGVFTAFFLFIAQSTTWSQKLDDLLTIRRWPFFATMTVKAFSLVMAVFFCYTFREELHLLGDSQAWFGNLDNALRGFPDPDPLWVKGIPFAGLNYLHPLEPLDFWIHLQAFKLGSWLFDWNAPDAYEWTSCLAVVPYLIVLWKISTALTQDFQKRLTFFVLLATTGQLQLFFGYAESYTLLTVASAFYAWSALRFLSGHRSLVWPTMAIMLASSLHVMAFSLGLSWLYLVWSHPSRIGAEFRKARVHWPLLVIGMALIAWAYPIVYADRHMPLFHYSEPGKYPIFSMPHLANLANTALLVFPFGFAFGGVALFRRTLRKPSEYFSMWAMLGTGGLLVVHDAYFGGRDWDLLSFPGLFCTLWGLLALQRLNSAKALRAVRWGVLPLMVLHTTLWIGVNAKAERAVKRMGHLLRYTPNLPLHYRAYYQGHYYMNINHQPERAANYFRKAIALAPIGEMAPEDITFRSRYLRMLGYTLVELGEIEEAIEVFSNAYPPSELPVFGEKSLEFQNRWLMAYLQLGKKYEQLDDTTRATQLWESAVASGRHLMLLHPDASIQRLVAMGLQALGRHTEAITALRNSLQIEKNMELRQKTVRALAEMGASP
ncbi:MAG: hypothetical protein ACI8P2_003941 [Candidatus Latescibacterota bacterium]|jgi:hypothetical protein